MPIHDRYLRPPSPLPFELFGQFVLGVAAGCALAALLRQLSWSWALLVLDLTSGTARVTRVSAGRSR